MILYSIRRGPKGHVITKFDDDFNVEASYDVTVGSCTCPAGPRPTCRHRKMLPRMLPKVGQPEFYCYETQSWHRPVEAYGAEPSEAGASEAYASAASRDYRARPPTAASLCAQPYGSPTPAPTPAPAIRRR